MSARGAQAQPQPVEASWFAQMGPTLVAIQNRLRGIEHGVVGIELAILQTTAHILEQLGALLFANVLLVVLHAPLIGRALPDFSEAPFAVSKAHASGSD